MLRGISAHKRAEHDLRRANEQLESRVAELTRNLHAVNQKLATANKAVRAVNERLHWTIREKEQEITVRQQAEHELQVKTEELERFFLLTHDLVCIIERPNKFRRVNRAFELTLGYSADELTRVPFLDFIHPDDVQETKNIMAGVFGGQATNGYCNRYQCKDGDYRWLEWTVFIDEETGVCYGVARDVTERRMAEAELRERSREVILARRKAEEGWRHLNNLLQNIDAVIWQLDRDGIITLYEGRLVKKMQVKSGEKVGLSIFELYKNNTEVLNALQRALKGIPAKVETKYQDMFISLICSPLIDADGNVSGVVGITADISARHVWERRLKFMQESRQRSLDFNEIMAGGYSEEEQNHRLGNYGIDGRKPVICYLLSVTRRNMANEDLIVSKEDVMEWLGKNGYTWGWYSGHGIGVLIQNRSTIAGDDCDQKSAAQALKAKIEKHFPEILVRIGVASTGSGALNLKQLYDKSYAALLLSMDDKEAGGVCHYSDSGIYQVLPFMIDHINIDDFVQRFLGKIIEYEEDKGGYLLATLGAILSCSNLKAAAKELYVHHNTVLWRKDKIEKILGYTIDDSNRRIHLAAAIKLRKIREIMQREL